MIPTLPATPTTPRPSRRARYPSLATHLSPLVTLAVLVVATLATRLPFMTQMLYSFDSANYAFALRDYYNVAHHQPHPPGYPLYVALAKLIDLVVGDPNRSLVLLSIGAAALAVGCTYWLGQAMLGSRTGVVAAIVLLTSAGFWGYSEVAYPYTFLAAASAALALMSWRIGLGARGLAAVSGLLLGAVAGIRWDAAVFLLPLWALALRRSPWLARGLAALGLVLACLLWAVPMVQLSGGWESYWATLRAQSAYVVGTYSPFSAGGLVLRLNLQTLLTYLRASLGISLLLLVIALGRVFSPWRLAADGRARFLLVWLLPPLSVYLLVHIGDPGYVLSVAPPASILVAWTLQDLGAELVAVGRLLAARWPGLSFGAPAFAASQAAVPLLGLLLIAAWNTNVFLHAPGPARLPELRLIDTTLRSQMDYVHAHFEPGKTLVLAHARFRQAQYYLRGYDVRLLFDEYQPDYRQARVNLTVSDSIAHVVVLDEDLRPPAGSTRTNRVVVHSQPEVAIWSFDIRGLHSIEYGYGHIAFNPGG